MLNEMNARHYSARRSLEDMQRTTGLFDFFWTGTVASSYEWSKKTQQKDHYTEDSIQETEKHQSGKIKQKTCGRLEAEVQQKDTATC